jgi:hypothetical protein
MWITVLFGSRRSPLYGELLAETFYVKQRIKYEHILISKNLYLFTYNVWVTVIVSLHLWSGSLILVILFYSLIYLTFVFYIPEDDSIVGRNI